MMAYAYVQLGDNEKALDWLETAYEQRFPQMVLLNTWPPWKGLHGNPRFENLRRKLGL
jgi:hypothetical protein